MVYRNWWRRINSLEADQSMYMHTVYNKDDNSSHKGRMDYSIMVL